MYNVHLMASNYYDTITKRRRKRSKKWLLEKETLTHLPLLKQLQQNEPDDFRNYLRMDSTTFERLLSMVKEGLTKQRTAMREPISPEERLIATLRFLATGRSYEDLKFLLGFLLKRSDTLYQRRVLLFTIRSKKNI